MDEQKDKDLRLRNFIDSLSDAMVIHDGDKIVFVNLAGARLVGVQPRDALIGKSIFEFISDEDADSIKTKIKNLLNSRKIISSFNAKLIKRTGEEIIVEITSSLIEFEGSNLIQGTIRDITEQEQLRESFHENLSRYEAIVENSPDAIIIHDGDKIIYANRKAARLAEATTAEELYGKSILSFIHRDDQKTVLSKIEEILKTGKPSSSDFIYRLIKPDKKIIRASIITSSVKLKGKYVFQSIIRDVTEAYELQNKLKERETRYRAIVENSPDAIIVHNGKVFKYANPTAAKVFGHENELNLIGLPIMNFVSEEFREIVKERIKKTLIGGEALQPLEEKIVLPSGKELFVEINGALIIYENEKAIQLVIRNITPLVESKERLLQSEQKYKSLFNSLSDGVFITDLDGKVLEANKAFCKRLEYDLDELIGLTPRDFAKEELVAELEKIIAETLEKGNLTFETVDISKSGKHLATEINATVINYSGKESILSVARDISERKKRENELIDLNKQLTMVTEIEKIGFTFFDALNLKGTFNKTFAEIYGISEKNEITFEEWLDYVAPEDRRLVKKLILRVSKNKKSSYAEFRAINRKDKKPRYIHGALDVVLDHDGNVKKVLGISVDITDKKIAQLGLEEAKKKIENDYNFLRLLADTNPDLLWAKDLDGNFIFVNQAICDVLLNAKDIFEPIGKNEMFFVNREREKHPGDKNWFTFGEECGYSDAITLKRGELSRFDEYGTVCGEFVFLDVFKAPLRNENGTVIGTVGSARIVTKEKKLEKERELIISELKDAIKTAEKANQLKSEFLAQISHEIRSPLNVILSFNEMIRSELGDTENELFQEAFTSIDHAGRRIIRTIELILNMSEIQKGIYEPEFRKMDLSSEILLPLFEEHKHAAKKKNIEFIDSFKNCSFPLLLDFYSASQIFANLIDNAIKYTEKGKVEIKAFVNEKNLPVVSVEDTGIGIAEEFLPTLFTPFTQEEQGYARTFDGNGLGLSLVQNYCSLNNAEIKVESKKGEGTKFIVTFK
ncbi:MAG: PAS domain S-box protein [Chlorobi bacterium]|nr:PAS domain S-box protein [Chlorobiota bacterium]